MRKRCMLCLSLALILLCGACGKGPNEAEVSPPAIYNPEVEQSAPPLIEPQTVTLLIQNADIRYQSAWYRETEAEINRRLFEAGAPLRLRIQYTSRFDEDIMHAGTLDLFIDAWGSRTQMLVQGGYVLDITRALRDVHPDLYALVPERIWKETAIDGSAYCFPLTGSSGTEWRWYDLQVRPDWLEELGLSFPETSEELHSTLIAAAAREGVPSKLLYYWEVPPLPLHREYPQWPFAADHGSRFILYDDGTVGPYIGSDAFYKDCAYMAMLNEQGFLRVYEGDLGKYLFIDEQYSNVLASFNPLFLPLPPSAIQRLENGGYLLAMDGQIAGLLAPGVPHTRLFDQPAASAVYVSSRCRDVDAAMMMLEYLYLHREITDVFFYGPPGEDTWRLNEDGTISGETHKGIPGAGHSAVGRAGSTDGERFRPLIVVYDGPTVPFAGSGFAFAEGRVPDPPWQGIDFTDLYRLRIGELPMSEMDIVLHRLNLQGYQEFLEEVQRQYAAYIGRCN